MMIILQNSVMIFYYGGVIFVQLILDNLDDNHFSPLVIGQKQWREKEEERIKTYVTLVIGQKQWREKEEERIKTYVSMRESCFKSCQKVVVQISFLFIM